MPHFFAKSLVSSNIANKCGEHFRFVLEAINPRDKSTLILAQNKSDLAQKIMLIKQQKNDKFLVKFNKHFKVQSREAIKNALKDYAKLTNAEIISHNLNANKAEAQSQYLLDSRGILGLFGESKDLKDLQNVGESDSIYSHESSESRFKNAPKMLEIGFGSGRHILNLAQNNPNALIIGLEIYRPAILQVLRQIEILELQNLYLASIDARVLFEVLPRESLSAIFLHFPVPWEKNPQRRVFSQIFLANAIRALSPQNGRFELITDSKEYFDFAKKIARGQRTKISINPQNAVVSKYEARWKRLQKKIYKLEIFPQKRRLFALVDLIKSFISKDSRDFADKSVLDSTKFILRDSFSQKGCTPRPALPTRQKLPLFAFRGRASLSPILAKNRHSHYCSFDSDFLHHESGEIRGASHDLVSSATLSPQNDESMDYYEISRHTERSEVSKSGESQINNESMTKERIDESHSFTQCKQIVCDSKVAKMDSSHYALKNDDRMNCHDSADADDEFASKTRNDEFFLDSLSPKICKKEYFLQIKDKYEFSDGFVIYVVFGAYYAPNSAYIIFKKNAPQEILGDIIPTKANLDALKLLGSYV